MNDQCTHLVDLAPGHPLRRPTVRRQAGAAGIWETAEAHMLDALLAERLRLVGITAWAEVGVALMASAMLLAERSPEFGGDTRDLLGLLARLGLELLERDG